LGGELRVGTGLALAEGIVLAIIERLERQNPRAVYHVAPGGLLALLDDLRARRIDLGVAGISRSGFDNDVDVESLFGERLVVVSALESPWSRRRSIKLVELVDECWTWPASGTMFDAFVLEAFRATGLEPPRAKVYTDAINMRMRLAETGRFLAIIPASIMKVAVKQRALKVLPVELPGTERQIAIVTLKGRTLSPLAKRFITCAREIAKFNTVPRDER
jgi:DNA-binding transcriptional LysR family regulator